MKKHIFLPLILSVLVLNVSVINAASSRPTFVSGETVNMPNEFEKIELLGNLMTGHGPNAIEAGASDNAVYIHFNQSFGNVSITIYNESGLTVYSTVLNTAVQQTIIIPITAANSGIYTVVVENATGYVEGEFDHD